MSVEYKSKQCSQRRRKKHTQQQQQHININIETTRATSKSTHSSSTESSGTTHTVCVLAISFSRSYARSFAYSLFGFSTVMILHFTIWIWHTHRHTPITRWLCPRTCMRCVEYRLLLLPFAIFFMCALVLTPSFCCYHCYCCTILQLLLFMFYVRSLVRCVWVAMCGCVYVWIFWVYLCISISSQVCVHSMHKRSLIHTHSECISIAFGFNVLALKLNRQISNSKYYADMFLLSLLIIGFEVITFKIQGKEN